MAKCILCPKEATATSKNGFPVCVKHKADDDANILVPRPKKDEPKKKERS
jgi:hypothetical protein